ncbi:cobalt-precorrin 5A hydrolase [uncultured Ruminococcus sp.]|uniref:cobalt-precorrin 5A hydrolase n=1 Tax=uncultured Ruminococcus sp. TaxID=165186 RepID=UPI0025E69874|nr:cobalt-precorrin 5A hydrolase [uncultured Ruminococcus sp.]
MMKAAVISISEKGRKLSLRIKKNADFIGVERFCLRSYSDFGSRCFEDIGGLVSDIWDRYDALVFICASGIAVRAIAPHISSKTTDPAVVVIDEDGRFAIPVLSGHIGGANALAVRLSELIGAQAAVTTATDTGGRFSPDSFAAANGLIITDMETAKLVASAVLSGERIGIISDYGFINLPEDITEDTNCNIGLYIGAEDKKPFPVTLRLVPKNVVIGIGCKRGTEFKTIDVLVRMALHNAKITMERVEKIATIDIKKDEQGLLQFCEKYGLELLTYTARELMETEGNFSSSLFVKKVTGVDNVCERSAVKCSGGRLIIRKKAANGVTVAAAEKPIILDFERKIL